MPHPNARLSYGPSISVLKHMDPNQRTLLVTKCPELKTPDRILPQKISTICVEPASITIDNTTYRMGIVLEYPKGATPPKRHVEINREYGVQYDLDKWGFRTLRPLGTPGDIYIPGTREPMHHELSQRLYNKDLDFLKEQLMYLLWRKSTSPTSALEELAELEKMIEAVEAELVPFRLKEDKKDVPFVLYLQLTILKNDPDGQKVEAIEKLEYNRPLRSALAYLIRRLLNRTAVSQANTLRIKSTMKRDFFWLPAEMKLAAENLSIDTNCANILGAIEQFIHPYHRRRFEDVSIALDRELNYNERILRTAVCLVIRHVNRPFLYGTIGHRFVEFDFCLDHRAFQFFIGRWRRIAPVIGTHYFSYTDLKNGIVWYDHMMSLGRFTVVRPTRRVRCLPECVILPLTDDVQLEFYITALPQHRNILGRLCTLLVNFEVTPRRHFI